MNKYTLFKPNSDTVEKTNIRKAVATLWPLMKKDKNRLVLAGMAGLVNSGLTLLGPLLIAHIVDTFLVQSNFHGVIVFGAFLVALYSGAAVANYVQTLSMGTVGQNLLFTLRNAIFNKLQELPVDFFNENKAGDLISRINNDTDKLNQFFSRSLMQFVSGLISIIGAAIFVISIHWNVGLALLSPAVVLFLLTWLISPWIKKRNMMSLQSTGGLSAEIQESLENFKVIVAFNRRDYFRKKFNDVNNSNYKAFIKAGVANNTLTPTYGFAASVAQLIVVVYGLSLIASGQFSLGLLISFLTYTTILYTPLRQIASIWSDFQQALAGWDRIHAILQLQNDLVLVPSTKSKRTHSLLAFEQVHFSYSNGKEILRDISFELESGKTYALVGPTGGGKTTTASLMARLYDPTSGSVYLNGKDIRSYTPKERTESIGFILQEPFMFTGTIRDNILYGNEMYRDFSDEALTAELVKMGLESLVALFKEGLATPVSASGGDLSLGQKQLIAFIRAILRSPALLILDEATANVDTITEQLLEEILQKLPATTTKVIIAHRLNTIENADEIFFINGGTVTPAGSMEHAVDMLMHGNRQS